MTDYNLCCTTKGNNKNPAIVFLHGFLGVGSDWDEIADCLCEDYFCVLLDLPGHGSSDFGSNPDNYSFQSTSLRIISLLDQLKINRTVLVGYSMGARLALYTSLHHSSRLIALILESVNTGLRSGLAISERLKLENQTCERLQDGMKPFLDDWYHLPIFQSLQAHPEKLESLKAKRLKNRPERLILSMKGIGLSQQPDLWPRLQQLDVPTLLIVGEMDEKFNKLANGIVEELPGAELAIVPESGHNSHLENPDQYLRFLENFIGGIPKRRDR